MTNPDELERAVERLTEMLPRLDACSGYAAHSGTPAARQTGKPRDLYWNDHLAADLRLILSANREMREALRPFSALADMVGESWTDETPAFVGADGVTITIGQLRKARSALTTQRGDGE